MLLGTVYEVGGVEGAGQFAQPIGGGRDASASPYHGKDLCERIR